MTFDPRAQEPAPAVVKLARLVALPMFPTTSAPPQLKDMVPGPSIVPKVMLFDPALVTVAVVAEVITTGWLNVIEAPDPDPHEIVHAPRPMLALGEFAVIPICPVPVPVVVTDPLVSIWTPLAAEVPPAPLRVIFPFTAVTVPPLT